MHRSYYYDHQPPQRTPFYSKRQFHHGLLIFFGLLLIIGISTTVILILQRRQVPTADVTPPTIIMPSEGEGSIVIPEDGTTITTTTMVERAPLDPSIQLELVDTINQEALSYQEIYQQNVRSIVSVQCTGATGLSVGTGVIFTEEGYIITNAHVIEGAFYLEIILFDDRVYSAQLAGYDEASDLAVLKIDAYNLSPAVFGNSDTLQVGDVALAIGNPLGNDLIGTMTDGIISAINRDVDVDGNTMVLLQTTAALNSGNSGGALINDQGQVIGITNMKMMSDYGTIEGLGFAIPSTTAKDVVDDLVAYGHLVNRPTIGIVVNIYPVTLEDGATGLMVMEVETLSDAFAQGLLPNDVIVQVNGLDVTSMDVISDLKAEMNVGDVMSCKVWREEEYITIEFALIDTYILDEVT